MTAVMSTGVVSLLAAGFGLIMGSFLSALTWRLPRGQSIAAGRSQCPSCHQVLGPPDLVPVLSWVVNRGRCRHCRAAVSARYPLIELTTAVMCALIAVVAPGWPVAVTLAALLSVFVALAVIDLEHGLLLDVLTIAAVPPALALRWLEGGATALGPALAGAAIAGFLALGLKMGFRRLTGRDGLGMGDVKFLAIAGLLLPVAAWPLFLFLAGGLGIALGLIWRALGRGPEFPFGPALIVALAALVLMNPSRAVAWLL